MVAKLLAVKYVNYHDKQNGNTYDAIAVCNLSNGMESRCIVDANSNIKGYLNKLLGDNWDNYRARIYECETELGSRLYDQFTKDCGYVHSYDSFREWLQLAVGFECPQHSNTVGDYLR